MSIAVDSRLDIRLDDENSRYHRQTLISWWEQQRLTSATVLVVGAGALGNELLKGLALLGVGRIVVIDLDQVENSNLSRCVLFHESDEGRPKALVAAEALARLNPDVEVVPVLGDVRTLGLGVFAGIDLALGGLDNREARLHVNQACWKLGVPFIDGAIEGLMGVARTFLPPDSACYECTMSDRDRALLAARKACSLLTREQMLEGRVPTTATSASIVAGIQVQEAVKLLHRDVVDYGFGGRGFAFNGLTHDSYVVTYPRDEHCMSHDTYEPSRRSTVPAQASLGDILTEGRRRLGRDAVLDLEQEVVLTATCNDCGRCEEVGRPLYQLKAGFGVCPVCGKSRHLDLLHTVTAEDERLLGRRPADLGIPAHDIVTARAGLKRWFFHLGDPARAIDALRTAA